MLLSTLSEVIWNTYSNGRQSATVRSFSKTDVTQHVIMAYNEVMRLFYSQSKKAGNGEEYYFISTLLSKKQFQLSDTDYNGMRTADISGIDFYTLPKNSHIRNATIVGNCRVNRAVVVTQVKPSEETFYLQPKFNKFLFFVIKGNTLETYNIPSCANAIEIEATYTKKDAELTNDIASSVTNHVLNILYRNQGSANSDIDNPYTNAKNIINQRLQQQPTPQE